VITPTFGRWPGQLFNDEEVAGSFCWGSLLQYNKQETRATDAERWHLPLIMLVEGMLIGLFEYTHYIGQLHLPDSTLFAAGHIRTRAFIGMSRTATGMVSGIVTDGLGHM
jgi:hypothetical protein